MKPLNLATILATVVTSASLQAQAQQGLRLFSAPGGTHQLQLVDSEGELVHTWATPDDTLATHFGPDGSVFCTTFDPNNAFPGVTGRLQQRDLDGNMIWDVLINSPQRLMHHDFHVLPNGNVLVMTVDNLVRANALADGRNPALLAANTWLPETIIEIQRTGPSSAHIVWEWHAADHWIQDFDPTLPNFGVVADHPGRIDINYPPVPLNIVGDVHHCNAIDYDPVNDWIIISAREQDEVWLIDHSTTTAEAAGSTGGLRGRGGDLLWRWGNPEAYGRGTAADRQLFRQHDPRFIPAGYPGEGNITIFNNQVTPTQSAVIEIELPVDGQGMPFIDAGSNKFGPAAPVWTYMAPGFFSGFVSGAQRLQNGNTLICEGQFRRLFEIDPAGNIVWQYVDPAPGGFIFKCDFVDRSMWTRTQEFSRSTGGAMSSTTLNDSDLAGYTYVLLASFSPEGTTPLPGGFELPFTADIVTNGMLSFPNSPLFVNTLGTLDALGRADSQIATPPNFLSPILLGQQLEAAYVIVDAGGAIEKVTSSTLVTIVP